MSNIPENVSNGPGRPKDPSKHQAILEAAQELFLSKGYDGCSMDSIARAANVSKLTVYSHFNDKETLFACAIRAKCEEQLPQPIFSLSPDSDIELALLTIGRAFNHLVNSKESLALQRLMVSQAVQNPQLSQAFFEAGPQRVLDAMQQLLEQSNTHRLLTISNPQQAAEHFFCLIKGGCNFRLLMGLTPSLSNTAENHVHGVVTMFLQAYRT